MSMKNHTNLENATDLVFLFLITLHYVWEQELTPIPLGSQYWWDGDQFHGDGEGGGGQGWTQIEGPGLCHILVREYMGGQI